jgi:hypothetical protein
MAESDIKNNIKKVRLSHVSAPINDDSEFHIRDSELSVIPDDGERGFVCFPVQCVNHGDDSGKPMHRFVQVGKADFHYALKETVDEKIKRVAKAKILNKEK